MTWRNLKATEKQIASIYRMRSALGWDDTGRYPEELSRGQASDEIARMQKQIHKNLSIGGVFNAKHFRGY